MNHDGVFDLRSMYYTTEELWFVEWDHEGSYFDNPDGFESHNPALLVDRWRTPMLVIHGALDFRVPETQGLAAFTALRAAGRARPVPPLPGREPLGAPSGEQRSVARGGPGMARPLARTVDGAARNWPRIGCGVVVAVIAPLATAAAQDA